MDYSIQTSHKSFNRFYLPYKSWKICKLLFKISQTPFSIVSCSNERHTQFPSSYIPNHFPPIPIPSSPFTLLKAREPLLLKLIYSFSKFFLIYTPPSDFMYISSVYYIDASSVTHHFPVFIPLYNTLVHLFEHTTPFSTSVSYVRIPAIIHETHFKTLLLSIFLSFFLLFFSPHHDILPSSLGHVCRVKWP